MGLPRPHGIEPATADDFVAGPRWLPRLLFAGGALAAAWLSALVLHRWGHGSVGLGGVLLAFLGGLAGVVAQRICLRRDVPRVLTLEAASREETERGTLSFWRFAEPVPAGLAPRDVADDWALRAAPGDAVAVRVQETGFGGLNLVIGTPTAEGWRLPAPQPDWPVVAQLYATFACVAAVAVVVLAASPSQVLPAHVVAAEQAPWVTGLGDTPWTLTVEVAGDDAAAIELAFEVSHAELLRLLPRNAQRALAAPGLLPGAERDALWARYLPVGRAVGVRHTWLGPWEAWLYAGPAPEVGVGIR